MGAHASSSPPYVRVDDGVREGGEVSMFYDPMIAKLITWAPTREAAIDAQVAALDRFEIEGPGTNLDFLSALMQHPRFRSGKITTGFIAEEYPDGFHGAPASPELLRQVAAVATVIDLEQTARARSIDGQLGGAVVGDTRRVVLLAGERFEMSVDGYDGGLLVNYDEAEPPLDVIGHWQPGQSAVTMRIDGEPLTVKVARTRRGWRLNLRGKSHDVRVYPPHVAALTRHLLEKVPPDLSKFLIAPMPGLLVRLDVKEGDTVQAGQPLAVVEAMKMENILRAEKTATVKEISAQQGESLAVDQVILELE